MPNRAHEHDCLICGPCECRIYDCDLPTIVSSCPECRGRRCRICQKIGPDKYRRIPDVPYEGGWAHDSCVAEEVRAEEMHNEADGWDPPPTPRFSL